MSTATFFGVADMSISAVVWIGTMLALPAGVISPPPVRSYSRALSGLTAQFVQRIRIAADRLVVVQSDVQQREAVVIGDRLTGLHVIDVDQATQADEIGDHRLRRGGGAPHRVPPPGRSPRERRGRGHPVMLQIAPGTGQREAEHTGRMEMRVQLLARTHAQDVGKTRLAAGAETER